MTSNEDFLRLADPLRRELLAHCYRMMGSVHDAEDLVQETYLRAWKAYDGFEGRSSLRTWLYRIATTTCLTALDSRKKRALPTGLGAPSADPTAPLVERAEVPWLEPIPDSMITSGGDDPATIVSARESIRLALIAALQYLPPRQRAILILRDVLRWKATEVADALDTTVAAVNSGLQRARAQLADVAPTEDDAYEPLSTEQQSQLDKYVAAFENYDISALVNLFTKDAIWEMPPFTGWYQGAETIGTLISTQCPAQRAGDLRLVPTAGANGQPAFGMYLLDGDTYRRFSILTVTFEGDKISHGGMFFEPRLFETFGLPETIEAN